ncbi:MAG: thiamine-phosphate kinase [Deltaproteobacteria bacterium]|nr:thiamine-phosphate kinase [Deltaproteobacteria bacterium]
MNLEFARIARLQRRFRQPHPDVVAIGDDAAVLPPSSEALVLTVDASVEGVHFRREWLSWREVAMRAVHAAASDVAAMGGDFASHSAGLLFALELPTEGFSEGDFDELIEGLALAAESLNAQVLGGNLARAASSHVSITTTALGVVRGPKLLRSGAVPGDSLCVTGPVGAAAVGLRALIAQREAEPAFARFVQAWRHPRAHLEAGSELTRIATACIDVSDGLLQDASHLALASHVGLEITSSRIPMLEGQRSAALALAGDALALALTGGEDYVLLFTSKNPENYCTIGRVTAGTGVRVDGVEIGTAAPSLGWDHFKT